MQLKYMTLIQVKYLGATNTMGSRIKCSLFKCSETESRDYSKEPYEQSLRMAKAIAKANDLKLCGRAQALDKDVSYFICK